MSEHILVVEDDQGIADTLRRGLIFEGYRVTVAYDGEQALSIARDPGNWPDLVVLDWMLPGLDGLEVCRRLRAASDVPILMLTAKDSVPERVEGLDAGADDYLIKPFSFDELLARINSCLSPEEKLESIGGRNVPLMGVSCSFQDQVVPEQNQDRDQSGL